MATTKALELSQFSSGLIVDEATDIATLGVEVGINELKIGSTTVIDSSRNATFTGFTSTGIDDNATATALTITANGHIGVGVPTPSAWGGIADNVLEFAGGGHIFGVANDNYFSIGSNTYYDGTVWRYKTAGVASTMYHQDAGRHEFFTSPVATSANQEITTTIESLEINASGNLDVKTKLAVGYSDFTNIPTNGAAFLGSVGIGTATPNAKLSVLSGTEASGGMSIAVTGETYGPNSISARSSSVYDVAGTVLRVGAYPNGVNTGALINFNAYNSTDGATGAYIGAVAGPTGNGPANFVIGRRTSTQAWAESLRVDTSGNVGIGTTSPQAKLHIDAGSGAISIRDYKSIVYNLDASIPEGATYQRFSIGINTGNTTYPRTAAYVKVTVVPNPDGGIGLVHSSTAEFNIWRVDGNNNADFKIVNVDNGTIGIATPVASGNTILFGFTMPSNGTGTTPTFTIKIEIIAGDVGNYVITPITGAVAHTGAVLSGYKIITSGTTPTKVGIGTTSPYTALHVAGGHLIANVADTAPTDSTSDSKNTGFGFKVALGNVLGALINSTANGNWGADINFNVRNTGGGVFPATPAMVVRSGGNVGIGRTDPGARLELYKSLATSTTAEKMLIINTDFTSGVGTGFGGAIVFSGRTAGNLMQDNAQILAYNENAHDNGYALGFYTRPSNAGGLQQRMTILRNGNVGIGTSNPQSRLHAFAAINEAISLVSESDSFAAIAQNFSETRQCSFNVGSSSNFRISNIVTTATGWRAIFRGTWSNNYEGGGLFSVAPYIEVNAANPTIVVGSRTLTVSRDANGYLIVNASDAYRITFAGSIEITQNPQSAQAANSIVTIGNVGIGLTDPSAKLHVRGSTNDSIVAASSNFKVEAANGDGIAMGSLTSAPWGSWIQSGYLGNGYSPAWNGGYPLALNPVGGNVGIGTTTPDSKLQVDGTFKASTVSNALYTEYYYIEPFGPQSAALTQTWDWFCPSYFQAEVIIVNSQSNGGPSNNYYLRGIWANNYDTHEWLQLDQAGSLTNASYTISATSSNGTASGGGNAFANGRLRLVMNYAGGFGSVQSTRILIRVMNAYMTGYTFTSV